MSEFPVTSKNKVKISSKRAHYDRKTIHSILDEARICHIGFIHEGYPVVIPTIFGREGDELFIHGAMGSRMLKTLEGGADLSLTVTHLDGLVLARSAFHHSMNYRSVVVFGKAEVVDSPEGKMKALKVISDQVLKGRWEEVRPPNEKELKITKVLKLRLEVVSAKVRTGKPIDEPEDYNLDVWAGELPFKTIAQIPINDPELKDGVPVSQSVSSLFS